jgi:hypothetical protein
MMFRRNAVVTAGGYRSVGPAEDYDLWVRLSESHQIGCLPDVLLRYRQNSAGVSMQSLSEQRSALRAIRDDLHRVRPLTGVTTRSIREGGISHLVSYSRTCPSAGRTYVFDHMWLALLCLQNRRLAATARIVFGVATLVVIRPALARGLIDVLRVR